MRLVAVGYPYTSKLTVESRLSQLHRETPVVQVIGWAGNAPSSKAVDWADVRNIRCTLVGGGTKVERPEYRLGRDYGRRAEIVSIFKVYAPTCLVVFGDEAFVEGGVGKIFVSMAEKVGAELLFAESVHEKVRGGWLKPRETCGVTRPRGKTGCGKFKGHPGVLHSVYRDGKEVDRFVLPEDRRKA